MDDVDRISVIDAAEQLGRQKAYLFKVLKRLNIQSTKGVSERSRGQQVAYITRAEFRLVQEDLVATDSAASSPDTVPSAGVFYLIQLEPEHDPGRFKLGFAGNLDERLRAHRTAAPLCKVVKSWPCRQLWEKTAIESISQGYEQLHTEVFRCADLDEVAARGDAFFELMPTIT
ncbi:MAG: hypothetical protein AAFU73_11045 [Planctomycetota bacterium]